MAIYQKDLYGLSKYGSANSTGEVIVDPTGSYTPISLVDYSVDPFFATPLSYSTVRLSWQKPGGSWSGLRIVRSRAGHAISLEDGVTIFNGTNTPTSGEPLTSYLDYGLQGGWQYYTIFIYNNARDGWERAALAHALVPYDYGSAEKLLELIPEYYKNIRDTSAGYSPALYDINPQIYLSNDNTVENEHLIKFLNIFGWGFDILRSQIDTTLEGFDTHRMHTNRLSLLSEQFGNTLEYVVPAENNRSLVRNLALLYRKRGTLDGIRETLAIASGWDVDVTLGANLMLSKDQANFESPVLQEWDQGTRYLTGEYVQYNRNYFQALQTAYGAAQAPPETATSNAYWNADKFVEPEPETKINRFDTGDVGTWQIVGGDGVVVNGGTSIGLGSPDPITGINSNSLMFKNTADSPADIVVRSIPRYTDSPGVFDRKLTVTSGIPIPQVTTLWSSARQYYTGDRVMYQGCPYEALLPTKELPTTVTDWRRLGVDSRVRVAMSFYAHGPFTGAANTGGVPVYPYFLCFDERGDFISEVTTNASGLAVYDPFNLNSGAVSGNQIFVGAATWNSDGSGAAWTKGVDDLSAFVYPSGPGRAYQLVTTTMSNGNVGVTFRSVGTRPMGVVFRFSDATNFWEATQNQLAKIVNGTRSVVASWANLVAGDRLTVSFQGNTITAKKNGTTTLATASDAFNVSATKHGIVAEN